MKHWFLCLVVLALAACGGGTSSFGAAQDEPSDTRGESAEPTIARVEVTLEDYGAAPELNNEVWLNTDQPLRLADSRGKVVLIDFWTFG